MADFIHRLTSAFLDHKKKAQLDATLANGMQATTCVFAKSSDFFLDPNLDKDGLSAYLKWFRVQKAASILGKGSKHKNALLLRCEHWLEAADKQYHRYGSNLRHYFDYWVEQEVEALQGSPHSPARDDVVSGREPLVAHNNLTALNGIAAASSTTSKAAASNAPDNVSPGASKSLSKQSDAVAGDELASCEQQQQDPEAVVADAAAAEALQVGDAEALVTCAARSRSEQSCNNFFWWLDYGSGRHVDLEACPRSKLDSQRVIYLTPEELEQQEVVVDPASGLLIYKCSRQPVHTGPLGMQGDASTGRVQGDDAAAAASQQQVQPQQAGVAQIAGGMAEGSQHQHQHQHQQEQQEQQEQQKQQEQQEQEQEQQEQHQEQEDHLDASPKSHHDLHPWLRLPVHQPCDAPTETAAAAAAASTLQGLLADEPEHSQPIEHPPSTPLPAPCIESNHNNHTSDATHDNHLASEPDACVEAGPTAADTGSRAQTPDAAAAAGDVSQDPCPLAAPAPMTEQFDLPQVLAPSTPCSTPAEGCRDAAATRTTGPVANDAEPCTGPPAQDASSEEPTEKDSGSHKWIYVVNAEKRLFVHRKLKGKFHHSSFLRGGAVLAAGGMLVEHGQLIKLTADSGHYHPKPEHFRWFYNHLKALGADLSQLEGLQFNTKY